MDQLAFLMNEYPFVKDIVVFMVTCRLVFKPIFTFLGRYVKLTIEQEDDKKLHNIMNTKWYKILVILTDMIASIKLPKLKRK
jgi:hypothetical protein